MEQQLNLNTQELTIQDMKALFANDSPLILDIGANDGYDSIRFIEGFPAATIFAFEPDPRAYKKLVRNISHRVEGVFEIAISAQNGISDFYQSTGTPPNPAFAEVMPEGWDQSGSLRKPSDLNTERNPWLQFKEELLTVTTMKLDSWMEQQNLSGEVIDFIWLDVQGAEGDVLDGAEEALKKTRFIHLEYSDGEEYEGQPSLKELEQKLADFSIVQVYAGDVLFRNNKL